MIGVGRCGGIKAYTTSAPQPPPFSRFVATTDRFPDLTTPPTPLYHPPVLATPLTLRAPAATVGLETNLLLAPIAGWCDLAWRETCRSCGGVGLACTDLLSPVGLICGSEASADLARTSSLDQPIGMQLYGGDPELLSQGARWCAEHGATVVDINMGCPVDKVCKKDGGSKLMCDVPRTLDTFEAVRRALPSHIPLTAKMRLGWSEDDFQRGVACELAVGLCARGAAMITVHGRTTEQLFKGTVRREGIARVVEAVAQSTGKYDGTPTGGVPVIGNGDIATTDDVLGMMNETNCAGVMIGRGAFSNPWLFRQAWAAQQGIDPGPLQPTEDERLDLVLAFFERMLEYRNERHAMHTIRQKITRLGKTINGSHCKALKLSIKAAQTPDEVREAIHAWRVRPTQPADIA